MRVCPSLRLVHAALAAACVAAAPQRALALDPGTRLTQYTLDVWQNEQGLPQNSVTALARTADGFLWLGTQDGLARFDGVRFELFDTTTTPALPSGYVSALTADADAVWIGTADALCLLRRMSLSCYGREAGIPEGYVQSIVPDGRGGLWLTTSKGGAARFSDGKAQPSAALEGFAGRTALSRALLDRQGRLWLASRGAGLRRLDAPATGSAKVGFADFTRAGQGLSNDFVLSLYEDRAQDLWAGTRDGLNRIRDGKVTTYGREQGLSETAVKAVFEDRAGTLWVGTLGGGLFRRVGERFEALTTAGGLPSNYVWTVLEDPEGSLWVGTDGGGLARLADPKLFTFGRAEGLGADNALVVLESPSGELWTGTQGGGVSVFSPGPGRPLRKTLTRAEGLPDDTVQALLHARDGAMWIGTKAGLLRVADGRSQAYGAQAGLTSQNVSALVEAKDGTLYVGTYGAGVLRKEGERFVPLPGSAEATVFALLAAKDGSLWAGGPTGAVRWKDGQPQAFGTAQGLKSAAVWSLYEDARGTLFAGTGGGGLSRFEGQRFATVTSRQGLFNDVILGILEDDAGQVWLSCNKGLFSVPRERLDAVLDGRAASLVSAVYGKADGMRSAECNGTMQPAAWKGQDGTLWFPTLRGVVAVDPRRFKKNAFAPPVHVERVVSPLGTLVAPTAQAHFPAGSRNLEIRYTALALLHPERTRFRYRLDGYDENWVEAGARRAAYYTNLAPGTYRFEVTATNEDGVQSAAPAVFSFDVAPFFYQTGWFFGLCAFAAALMTTGGYRVRVRQLTRKHLAEVARKEMEKDLELTAAVQSLFLPPNRSYSDARVAVRGLYRPTAKSGGDWWWYDVTDPKKLTLLLGDVTGHGAASAMITAAVATGLRVFNRFRRERALPDRLAELNEEVRDICRGQYHMTLLALELELDTGLLKAWGAASPPVLVRTAQKLVTLPLAGGPLGTEDFSLGYRERTLAVGDRVFAFTDGLPELVLPEGKQLGLKKLSELFTQTAAAPLDDAAEQLLRGLDDARGATPQEDDLTFALLERRA